MMDTWRSVPFLNLRIAVTAPSALEEIAWTESIPSSHTLSEFTSRARTLEQMFAVQPTPWSVTVLAEPSDIVSMARNDER